MWNGLRTQEALLGGIFGRAPFLAVGTPEEPCPYTSKSPVRDSFKGKQFGTAQSRTGRMPQDFFDTKFKPLFEGDQYRERLPYRELQPEKPGKAFLTSDFSKRDEFSLTTRMEQHRHQIKHEARMQKEAEQKLAARGGASTGGAGAGAAGQETSRRQGPLLFDLVYEGEAELCIKARRDTRNPTALSSERKVGPYKTTAGLAHTAPAKVCPPQYGHRRMLDS